MILFVILGIAVIIAYSIYEDSKEFFIPVVVVGLGVGTCFYLNSGYIKDLFSSRTYKRDEYALILGKNSIEIKTTRPTIGSGFINEVNYAKSPSYIAEDVFDSFSMLRRWAYTSGTTNVYLTIIDEDRYGKKVEKNKLHIITLNSSEVNKFSSFSAFNRQYHLDQLISNFIAGNIGSPKLPW